MTDAKSDQDRFAVWDQAFAEFQARNPGASFTKMQMEKVAQALERGAEHPTLGSRVRGFENWWDAGASAFERYRDLFQISEHHKVVDYGCGSLRVGGHFIRFLNPGNYFGLELTSSLYELGRANIGAALEQEKQPRFGVIGKDSVAAAADFGADFVFSTAVAFHVHPDEQSLYYRNLVTLAGKPGAVLFFDTKISEQPLRYRERSWAWPLAHYLEALAPLKFVRDVKLAERTELGVSFENRILEFRRA